MTVIPEFSVFFKDLWGHEAFPWQRMLAGRLAKGEWPRALDLPTAAGKTACIDIALYALAAQADRAVWQRTAPRRIWFVVDRRIVVDEAFERACRIAKRLGEAGDGSLKAVADRLRAIGGTRRPVATARLRGGILRDDGWARLPSQPAVITSTVDQLGSRLLFRGYGRSSLTAPIYAGLAAHDSLIILDEAHLSVPFLDTLAAVERYRGGDWAEEPIRTPFAFAMLSATPPSHVQPSARFPGERRIEALDHPELERRMSARKLAELVQVKDRRDAEDPLVAEAVQRARDFLREGGCTRVAVVVNRVATAEAIAAALRDTVDELADVVLLTGRLRPFDRDLLLSAWGRVLDADSPAAPDRPVMLVATQTIEVGADFSFDAMVTEAASLDALRQRFGRLNRLGTRDSAPAAVLIRAADTKPGSSDPVYGQAMPACWELLKKLAKTDSSAGSEPAIVDFGVAAMDSRLAGEEGLDGSLAPVERAPVLLPAHLDLLCQTAPQPPVQPEVQLYLHGTGRGTPEVRVVWRADLHPDNPALWAETVALCPPNTGEALSVPLHRLRRWLVEKGLPDEDTEADVEGAVASDEGSGRERLRPVLIWRGRDRSEISTRPLNFRPNDLVVVPAAYGMKGLAQPIDSWAAVDIWEQSHRQSGRPTALRLHSAVMRPWLDDCPPLKALISLAESPDRDEESFQRAVDDVLDYRGEGDDDTLPLPDWLVDVLKITRNGKQEEHPAGGLILFARKSEANAAQEQDLFADDDDLLSVADRPMSLEAHSVSVERAVQRLAGSCLPEGFQQPLQAAAYWHDVGKLDDRFQFLLHQGDELSMAQGVPLAKSAEIPASSARRRWIRAASGLPEGFRHELLSLQLAERYGPVSANQGLGELMLHAVASHHGYGRPFAPVILDRQPPSVRGRHDGVDFNVDVETRQSWLAPHSITSGITERFWRLTRRYGWWGLAYLEAILRLGDWYGSHQIFEGPPPNTGRVDRPQGSGPSGNAGGHDIVLAGLDGSNPLGFLAALGTLAVLRAGGERNARLHWCRQFTWRPVVSGVSASDQDEVAARIAEVLKDEERAELSIGLAEDPGNRIIDCDADHYATVAGAAGAAARWDRRILVDFLAAFASDGSIDVDRRGKPRLQKMTGRPRLLSTPFQFTRGSGQQYFLGSVWKLVQEVDENRICEALFQAWRYQDEKFSLRWDPAEDRRYALMDRDPTATDNKTRTVWMANLLAYRALTLFPSAPQANGLRTVGWSSVNRTECFTWPIWERPCDPDTIKSVLLLPELYSEQPDREKLRERGVVASFRARRIRVGSGANFKLNFSPARGL